MQQLVAYAIASLSVTLRRLRHDDRGEGPVSTAIMVAIIAAGAAVVAGLVVAVATGWANTIPTSDGN